METDLKEIRIKGSPLSSGIAIGRSFFHMNHDDKSVSAKISLEEVEKELIHLKKAVAAVADDLNKLKQQLEKDSLTDSAAIIDAQIHLLADPLFIGEIFSQIKTKQQKADYLIQQFLKKYRKKFAKLANAFFQERFNEFQDIARRILAYLKGSNCRTFPDQVIDTILFVEELSPSETVEASTKNVKAIVSAKGSIAAHAAIVARAKEIPFMTNIPISKLAKEINGHVIVDGKKGELILNPTKSTLETYVQLLKNMRETEARLQSASFDSKTLDGTPIQIFANIENIGQIEQFQQYGATGIGLFRSENLLINKKSIPDEEEQFLIYKALIEKMKGAPVTIRVFDIGRDKAGIYDAKNPKASLLLGFRYITRHEHEKQIYMTQLRAIYRASKFGPIQVLFPMITSLPELVEAKKMTVQAANDVGCFDEVKIGCMIEIPSAALIMDLLAKECDFFSIGTNDLIQYMLAVDRCDDHLSHLYTPSHPSIVRVLVKIIEQARKTGKELSLCGEMALDPRYIPLLLGLGIERISVSARYIPLIRGTVKGLKISTCKALAKKVLALSSAEEIDQLLEKNLSLHPQYDLLANYLAEK